MIESRSIYKRVQGIAHLSILPKSKVINAAIGARSARFERGQVGAPDQWARG